MAANSWELRADVRPLELAARRWSEVGTLLTRRGDEIVEAARRATDGWDAASAESYEQHRRQVVAHLDRFAQLATEIAGSLRAVSSMLTATQTELDRAWTAVEMIPHEVVGESRYLVFRPVADDDRGKVDRGQVEADEIRSRLALSLDQESTRLRAARAEFSTVRTELATLAGGTLPEELVWGEGQSGVGTVLPASTSVPGSAQSGVAGIAGLPPIAPISVSMPDLTGLSASGLAPLAVTAASGLAASRAAAAGSSAGAPPMGGMGTGAMGARAGSSTSSRGAAGSRSGPRRAAVPTLADVNRDESTRLAREKDGAKQAEKDAKQAALAQRRAERAARRARREAERHGPVDESDDLQETGDLDESGDLDETGDLDESGTGATYDAPGAGDGADSGGEGRTGRA